MFESPKVRLEGRDTIVDLLTNLYVTRPDFDLNFQAVGIHPERPTLTDSVVSEYGTWRETWSAEDGQVAQTGTYYDVWLRGPEGWRIALHAFTMTGCRGSISVCGNP